MISGSRRWQNGARYGIITLARNYPRFIFNRILNGTKWWFVGWRKALSIKCWLCVWWWIGCNHLCCFILFFGCCTVMFGPLWHAFSWQASIRNYTIPFRFIPFYKNPHFTDFINVWIEIFRGVENLRLVHNIFVDDCKCDSLGRLFLSHL